MSERYVNARVHVHLVPALDAASEQMNVSRLLLNSAALYWFLKRLKPQERAELLGEYVKVLAMLGPRGEARRAGKGQAG